MAQFYFDYRDNQGRLDTDETGIEFPDLETAYLDAYRAAIDMWAESRRRGDNLGSASFTIRDRNGVLVELPFAEALGLKASDIR